MTYTVNSKNRLKGTQYIHTAAPQPLAPAYKDQDRHQSNEREPRLNKLTVV